jgi:hypothetical protein
MRRLERTQPVLDDLRAWVDEQRAMVPPKTPLGRALGYLHRQWRRLLLFLDDGNIEATNNRREREEDATGELVPVLVQLPREREKLRPQRPFLKRLGARSWTVVNRRPGSRNGLSP